MIDTVEIDVADMVEQESEPGQQGLRRIALDESTRRKKRVLACHRAGEWAVTTQRVPEEIDLFDPGYDYGDVFAITHVPTGRKAKETGDLWRAMLWCDALHQICQGVDMLDSHTNNRALYDQAREQVELRIDEARELLGEDDDHDDSEATPRDTADADLAAGMPASAIDWSEKETP